jgi:hypothetical protein
MTEADALPPEIDDPYALYRYFDTRSRLLYVGISGDLANRDRSHISRSRWMQLVASSTVERLKTLEDVQAAERKAIETERPLFNRLHNDTPEARERLRAYLDEIGRLDLLEACDTAPNGLNRVTVNLIPKAWDAVSETAERLQLSRTDVINRALQAYAWLEEEGAAGAEVFVRSKGGELERVKFL